MIIGLPGMHLMDIGGCGTCAKMRTQTECKSQGESHLLPQSQFVRQRWLGFVKLSRNVCILLNGITLFFDKHIGTRTSQWHCSPRDEVGLTC